MLQSMHFQEEIYWERRLTNNYGKTGHGSKLHTWKSRYLERHIQDKVENAQPEYGDESEIVESAILCNPYIHKLHITQLQAWKPPLTWDATETPDVYPIAHINLQLVLSKLTNLVELDICFGVKNIDLNFKWDMFKVSLDDIRHLGDAIRYLKLLKVFKLRNSNINDDHIRILAPSIISHGLIEELDFSHCIIGDNGALCIAKIMMTLTTLTKVRT